MHIKIKVTKDCLYDLYVIRGHPMHEIASELDIAIGTVYNYLHKYEIEIKDWKSTFTFKNHKQTQSQKDALLKANTGRKMSEEHKIKISEANRIGGIGHKKNRPDGYIAIYFPDHPRSNKDGYIMEHDLVMESIIGRHLKDNECVHHINEIRNDNRKENLMLMTKSEHMSYHATKRHQNNRKKEGMTY